MHGSINSLMMMIRVLVVVRLLLWFYTFKTLAANAIKVLKISNDAAITTYLMYSFSTPLRFGWRSLRSAFASI